MRSFPDEAEQSSEMRQKLAPYFDLAERIHNFWLTHSRTEWLSKSILPSIVLNVATMLDIQIMRQFRSVIEECLRCEAYNANIIARSMFETVMAQRFVLAKRLCIVVEQKTDKKGCPEYYDDGSPIYRARIPSKKARPKK